MRAEILLVLPLAFAGCAQPFEGKVAARLADAGLSRPMAECMAERWVDRLNVLQLRKISKLADALKSEGDKLNVTRFVSRIQGLDDPEIVNVVTKSTVICALTA